MEHYIPEYYQEDFFPFVQRLAKRSVAQIKEEIPPLKRVAILDRLYLRESCLKNTLSLRQEEMRNLVLWDWQRATFLTSEDIRGVNSLCAEIEALYEETSALLHFRCNMEMLRLGTPKCGRRHPDSTRKDANMNECQEEEAILRRKYLDYQKLLQAARRIFWKIDSANKGTFVKTIPVEEREKYLSTLVGPRPKIEHRPLLTWQGARVVELREGQDIELGYDTAEMAGCSDQESVILTQHSEMERNDPGTQGTKTTVFPTCSSPTEKGSERKPRRKRSMSRPKSAQSLNYGRVTRV